MYFRCCLLISLVLVVVQCNDPVCDTTREYRDTLTQKVLDILVDAGYTIEDEGTYFYQGGTSLGGNGQSTYGMYQFNARGVGEDGIVWRQNSNEAIIFVGCTPPAASWRSYLWTVPPTRAARLYDPWPWSPLGETLNQYVLDTSGGDDPFSSTLAVITTADQVTQGVVASAFYDAGFSHVNFDLMPGKYLTFGSEAPSDTFLLLNRVAAYYDDEAGNYYMNTSAPAYIVRPPDSQASSLLDLLPERDTESGKNYLSSSLTELAAQVTSYWEDQGYTLKRQSDFTAVIKNWTSCITDYEFCYGISPDCSYGEFKRNLTLGPDGDTSSFYVVVGVSHYNAGFAQYTAIAVYNDATVELAGAIDTYYNESASFYSSDTPYQEQLFTIKISRVCDTTECCLEVPIESLAEGEKFFIMTRAYLNSKTKTSPDYNEILYPILLHFEK